MPAIDAAVELLKDGEWHNLQDLAKNLRLNQQELHEIIQFLQKLDLVRIDEKQQKAQINTELKRLIAL